MTTETPLFDHPLHVGKPHPVDREALFAHIEETLDSGRFANDGPKVHEFERRVCEFLGVEHCVATCNGTIALQILAKALQLQDEILMPSFTFVATAHAFAWMGLKPIFCDVDRVSWTISPYDVEAKITSRTSAIVGVHLWGQPCDFKTLEKVAKKHNLPLIFDAAHAFGVESPGDGRIGSNGLVEVFSFHATKALSTFEGGAVVTNSAAVAEHLRQLRSFGFVAKDDVRFLGTNGKMNEVAASMGLVSLDAFPQTVEINSHRYIEYKTALRGIPGIHLRPVRFRSNYQWVVITVDPEAAGLTRDELQKILWENNVLARRYFYPGCHRMRPYMHPEPQYRLPVTERVLEQVLSLPTGAQLEPGDARKIAEFIERTVRERCSRH